MILVLNLKKIVNSLIHPPLGPVAVEIWRYFASYFDIIDLNAVGVSSMLSLWILLSPKVFGGHVRFVIPLLILVLLGKGAVHLQALKLSFMWRIFWIKWRLRSYSINPRLQGTKIKGWDKKTVDLKPDVPDSI